MATPKPNSARVDYGTMLDATQRRYDMAIRLNCHPLTISLLRAAYDTASAVWTAHNACRPHGGAPLEEWDLPEQRLEEGDYVLSGSESTEYIPRGGQVPWPG